MTYFAGIDVSLEESSICVVEGTALVAGWDALKPPENCGSSLPSLYQGVPPNRTR